MDLLARVRQLTLGNVAIYRRRAKLRRQLTREQLVAPVRRTTIDSGELSEYAALQAARRREVGSVTSQLESFRRIPQFPSFSGRSIIQQGFRSNPVCRRAMDIYAEHIRLSVPKVLLPNGQEDLSNRGPAERMRRVIRHPSGMTGSMTWTVLVDRLVLDLFSTGNGFWEIADDTSGNQAFVLRRLEPENVSIVPLPHPEELVDFYIYRPTGNLGTQMTAGFAIPRERVIHWRIADPLDNFFGISPFFSALRVLSTDNDLIDFFKTTIRNMGVLPYVLTFDPVKAQEAGIQFRPDSAHGAPGTSAVSPEDVRDKFVETQAGIHRGKPGIAWGVEIQTMAIDFDKLAVGSLVQVTEERLLQVAGVPSSLVGRSGNQDQPNRSTQRQDREEFLTGPVSAMLIKIEEGLDVRFVPLFGTGHLRIKMDISGIGLLQEARLRRNVDASKVWISGLHGRHTCQQLAGEPTSGPNIFNDPGQRGRVEQQSDDEQSEAGRTD